MKTVCCALSIAGFAAAAAAQEATLTPTPEPNVQRIVAEDDGVRIEELRVRGQTRRIVVQPKVGQSAPYEIVPEDARDPSQSGSKGAQGKRVWPVFAF